MPEEKDPWLEEDKDGFNTFDTRTGETDFANQVVSAVATPEQIAAIEAEEARAAAENQPPPEEPVAPPADEPKVIKFDDGSSVTIEKTSRGLVATLDAGTGAGPEVFHGANEAELLTTIASAKVHATRKIRELNKQVKLGAVQKTDEPSKPQPNGTKQLTADEIFEITTQLKSNPDTALEGWFQKKYGLSLEQLVGMAKQGSHAKAEQEMEAVARNFVNDNPDYYADPEGVNYTSVVAFIAKKYLDKTLTLANREAVLAEVYHRGYWTTDNLQEAYDELLESGLLQTKPVEQPPVEVTPPAQTREAVVTPVAPAPASQPTAIPAARRKPRAAITLGIRSNESVTPVVPAETKAPSDEDLESMSTDDIAKLIAGVRQEVLKTGRRK